MVAERIKSVASLVTIATKQPNKGSYLSLLHKDLPLVLLKHRPDLTDDLHWNGVVLLGQP